MMGALAGLGAHVRSSPEVEQLAEAFGFMKRVPERREIEDREAPKPKPKRNPKKKPKPLEESSDDVIDLAPGPDGTYRKAR